MTITVGLVCSRCGQAHAVKAPQASKPRTAVISCTRCGRRSPLQVPAARSDPPPREHREAWTVEEAELQRRIEKTRREAALYGGSW